LRCARATPLPAAAIDWPARLRPFDPQTLIAVVGKTAFREALKLFAALETIAVEPADRSLKVTLPWKAERIEISIPAAGDFAAIASRVPPQRRPAMHAAATLAARRHFGLGLDPLPEEEATRAEFLPDRKLLKVVAEVLARVFAQGFAFPSQALEERLGLLAISGRAEAMPRLAQSLKRIAAALEQRRLRDVHHDAGALLTELGFAHALVTALSESQDEAHRRRLAGVSRAEYEPAGDLDLLGLGAALFETSTGAQGVSAFFVEPLSGRCFSASLARPNKQDTVFNPRAALESVIWGQKMSALAVARLSLRNAQVSASGRLSLAQDSRADRMTPFIPTRDWLQAQGAPLVHASWPALAATLAERFAPTLDAPPPAAAPVILFPARIAPIAFDDLTQSLTWPLMDGQGNWLALSLDHDLSGSGLGAHRIAALEARGDTAPKPFAIIALARPEGERLVLEPMTLWGEPSMLLDFPPKPVKAAPTLMAEIMARLRRTANRIASAVPMASEGVLITKLAQAGLEALIETAEGGNRPAKLAPIAQAFTIAGLEPLATLFTRASLCEEEDDAAASLAAAWGVAVIQGLARRLPVWKAG